MNELIDLEHLSVVPAEGEILALNEYTSQFGLTLTETEAKELAATRARALTENERIEIGAGILPEIIRRFSASRYITSENYTYVLNQITYYFHYIKTETDDRISDRDLIHELFERFELYCRGSMEMLENKEIERIIRKVNSGEHYYSWYRDRDELDYTGQEGSREAPVEYAADGAPNRPRALQISSFDESEFADDTPADHDMYEEDFDTNADRFDEDEFDLDAFDEFFDLASEENRPGRPDEEKKGEEDDE